MLEGTQERRGVTRVVQQALRSVENMQMVIAHSEITSSRTCLTTKEGKIVKEEDIGYNCERKSCMTCLAKEHTSGFKSSKYDMNKSHIPGQ
eukprot:11884424-Heterocapsa_arctica.AAC.1